jgi:hypothetical protein
MRWLALLTHARTYLLITFTGPTFRWQGADVHLGNVSPIVGWLTLAVGACKS